MATEITSPDATDLPRDPGRGPASGGRRAGGGMTLSPLARTASGVILAAWQQGQIARLSDQAAGALEAAQLLQSPETAAEFEDLRARVAELETAPTTVFRASHDSIVMGLYTTAAAARAHCEAEERRAWAKGSNPTFDWIEDEEDGVAEMTAWVGGEECTTGYIVTALTVASEYDADGDE